MNKFNLYIVVFGLFGMSFAFAQTKNEKEERVRFSELPEEVQNYLGSILTKTKSLKFYKETDGENVSFETKFKLKKQHYSLEFNMEGILEDIEIITKKKYIETPVFDIISNYFDENFGKTRFIKIQKQYKNNTNKSDQEFIQYIFNHQNKSRPNFEIIAEVNDNGKQILKEFTFDSDGQFIKSRVVISSSYGHVLY